MASGVLRVGDAVVSLPGKHPAVVTEILTADGPAQEAPADRAVTVRLDREIDVSRGGLFSSVESMPRVSQEISPDVCWFDTEPALMSQPYVLKQSVNSLRAKFQAIDHRIDVQSLQPEAAPPTLEMNDIARVRLKVTKPIAFDLYEDNRTTGAFVLIDERTNRTVAAGTIR